jgi:hypothetical protein
MVLLTAPHVEFKTKVMLARTWIEVTHSVGDIQNYEIRSFVVDGGGFGCDEFLGYPHMEVAISPAYDPSPSIKAPNGNNGPQVRITNPCSIKSSVAINSLVKFILSSKPLTRRARLVWPARVGCG